MDSRYLQNGVPESGGRWTDIRQSWILDHTQREQMVGKMNLDEVNKVRIEHGEAPLRWDEQTQKYVIATPSYIWQQCAQWHSDQGMHINGSMDRYNPYYDGIDYF